MSHNRANELMNSFSLPTGHVENLNSLRKKDILKVIISPFGIRPASHLGQRPETNIRKFSLTVCLGQIKEMIDR